MSFLKIIHFYWGKNQPLSYLRALSVISFQKLNPDWNIKLWVPKVTSSNMSWQTGEQPSFYCGYDYLQDLEEFICKIDFAEIGIPDSLPEVHKADLIRWYLLGEYGGIWSDIDILYIRSICKCRTDDWSGVGLCQTKAVKGNDKKYTVIGFMTSEGQYGLHFFNRLFQYGLARMPQTRYQAFGAELLDEFLRQELPYIPFYHDPRIVYPLCTGDEIPNYFKTEKIIHSWEDFDSIGLHWYGGNPVCARKEAEIFRNLSEKFVICQEAKRVLS